MRDQDQQAKCRKHRCNTTNLGAAGAAARPSASSRSLGTDVLATCEVPDGYLRTDSTGAQSS